MSVCPPVYQSQEATKAPLQACFGAKAQEKEKEVILHSYEDKGPQLVAPQGARLALGSLGLQSQQWTGIWGGAMG